MDQPKADGKEKEKGRSPLQQFRSVWPELWALIKPRRGLLLGGLALMIVNRISGLALPGAAKLLVDDIIMMRHTAILVPLVVGLVVATFIQGASSFALTQLLSKAAQRLIAELRQKIQAHISRLSVAYYDANKTGQLVSRIMTDVEGVRNLIGTGLVEFVGGLITASIALVILVYISPTMTLAAVVCLAAFALILKRAFVTLRPIYRERGKINAEVTGRLTESLGGVRVIKGYRAEEREQQVFAGGVHRLLDNVLKTLTGTSLLTFSSIVLIGLVGAVVIYMGAKQILAGTLTLGAYFTYNILLGYVAAPVIGIVSIGTQITEAIAGLDRMREVLSERPEDRDPQRTGTLENAQGGIRFENVDFAYEAGKPVLKNLSFEAPPGTVTALVGSSGSGKSTIISLIAAFYKPGSGRILVDGVDLSQLRLDSYRKLLGVVFQESFLFDGTIRENVLFSKPDAAEEDLVRVCKIARVDEFAEKYPTGYETVVGERGVKLSGGQRQRLSIARALLADPRILILDEATSSLDSESEAMIQQGLSHLMKGRTTFVIAHRLSTIRKADQILVVEAGEIVERGTHEKLLAAHGRYHELYTRQHGLESNLFLAPGEGDKVVEESKESPSAPARASINPMGLS
ncbi:MAG: ABC transporter ATP-binding protein [Planctomycetaceae bacterium]|nr:ABC transporter ATP-binding protein [Planctomycetaceae bacterium]